MNFFLPLTLACCPDERNEGQGQGVPQDPFFNIRDETNNPALFVLCCCACCWFVLYFGFIAWAITTVMGSDGARETDCGIIYDLWMFNAIALLAGGLFAIDGCLRLCNQTLLGALLAFVAALTYVILAIWGFFMWLRMSDSCDLFFTRSYYDLFLLFKINVIFYCIFFCCSIIIAVRSVPPKCLPHPSDRLFSILGLSDAI
jgi:hypothetical protein